MANGLVRFRLPLPTSALPLPRELRGHVGTFLGQGLPGDLQLSLVLLRHGAQQRMKRCTLCPGCRQTYTYNALCTSCDNAAWMDMS